MEARRVKPCRAASYVFRSPRHRLKEQPGTNGKRDASDWSNDSVASSIRVARERGDCCTKDPQLENGGPRRRRSAANNGRFVTAGLPELRRCGLLVQPCDARVLASWMD